MGISFNTVLLLSILIINVQQLESFKLHTRNEPVPPCCQQPLFSLFSYSPCACPPHYSTTVPPKVKPIKHEIVKVEYTKPKYPLTTVPPPTTYHVNKCGPPQCYVNPAKQAAELEKIFKDASSTIIDYTATATGPVIYVAESISHGADLIPMLFAASGDLLGKAIAGPIKFFNKLGFGFLTGAISQVISIPITFGTSVRASIINVQPYLEKIMSIGNGCCSQTTQAQAPAPPAQAFIGSGIEQIALKPIGILAGASHLALGTMLNIGGSSFQLIGTLTKNAGYEMQTTGALKVVNGVSSIASFLQKLGQPSSVICIVENDKINFYQHVDEKKKEKVDKIEKVEKFDKIKPIKVTVPSEPTIPYKPTTPLYVPTTVKAIVTTPLSTTVKYIPVTTPYPVQPTTVQKVTTTTTLMPPYLPNVVDYDQLNIPDEPVYPEGVGPYLDGSPEHNLEED